jgi:hypothetical protein
MTTIRTTCHRSRVLAMGTIQKPADRKVVVLLPSAGVEVDERAPEQTTFQDIFKATEQAAHPATEERPAGPPFTVDDLIAFHFLLKDAENLSRAFPHG